MIFPHGELGDFYHRYRPMTFDEVIGQDSVISSIRKVVVEANSSRSFLFFGESGCGKTTCARLLSMAVNCLDRNGDNPCCKCNSCKAIMDGTNLDVKEFNSADTRGIDGVREIKESMQLFSMFGGKKFYILDECHSLTKEAQQSILKVLEEAPKDVYIILCSTEPKKLLPTVLNRCQKFEFKPLSESKLISLMEQVSTFEGITPSNAVLQKIAENSSGSARNCLVYLQQVVQANLQEGPIESVDDILSVVSDDSKEAIALCLSLIKREKWSSITDVLSKMKVPPEVVRLTVLGFFRSKLLKAKSHLEAESFASIMETLIEPYYSVRPENNLVLSIYKTWSILKGKG